MSTPEHEVALATLSQFYEAEAAYLSSGDGDFSAIAVTLDPECVIYQPASLTYAGEWRGHVGFEAWMKAFAQQWSSLDVKYAEVYPSGDVVVSRSHVYATAKKTGKHLDWPLLQFFKFRQGILELRPFYWDTAALTASIVTV